jgi:hypothetical protein
VGGAAESPGPRHYIIHSYDVPALAPQAAAAARRYADIAPAAAHALHMPSHTFTRLGQWEPSVRANRRSAEAALRDSSLAEVLHASDYLVYAYLQMARDSAAQAVLDGLPALAARFDPSAVTGAAPGWAGVFALAAMPARYALERRAWADAASLAPAPSAFPYTEAMTYFARALGAAHVGRPAVARAAADSLSAIHARLLAAASRTGPSRSRSSSSARGRGWHSLRVVRTPPSRTCARRPRARTRPRRAP